MINLQRVENAMKSVCLDILKYQLDNCDVFLSKVKQTTADVWGKEIISLLHIADEKYVSLKEELDTYEGTIEISDKGIRVCQNNVGAFVNLLNSEMESLLYQAKEKIIPKIYKSLERLFADKKTIYGVDRKLSPKLKLNIEKTNQVDNNYLRVLIDKYDSETDLIIMSSKNFRDYKYWLEMNKMNIDIIDAGNGFKGVKFDETVIIGERSLPENTIYLLNTKEFKIHKLCDWVWLDIDNKILRQIYARPVYNATLVKYCNFMCHNPSKQVKVIVEKKQ